MRLVATMIVGAAGIVGAGVGFAGPADPALIPDSLRRLLLDEIRGQVALDHVWQLTTFDRTATTAGFHQAISYVRDAAQEAGLDNVEVIRFPADGRSRVLDTYRSMWAWQFDGGELSFADSGERICGYREIATCIVKYSQGVDTVAELVDVGDGVSPAGYEGKNVDGKLVLASSQASAVLAYARGRHDILGVISYWGNYLPDRSPFPDQVAWQAIPQDPDRGDFAFSVSRRMAHDLRQRLQRGPVRLRARIDAELHEGEYEMLTGVIPGTDPAGEEVLIISHLNHHRPGANDNASGSALSLELGAAIHRLIDRGALPRPRRSIRFLWVAEHRGTQIFLHLNRDYGQRGVAVFNNDMVGADQAESGSIFLLTRTPDFAPSYLNDLVASLLEEVAREQYRSPYGSRNPFHYRTVQYSGAISDHMYFVDTTVGVPAIMLSTDPDNFYHSNEDTADHIDATTLMRAGYVTAAAALWVAAAGADETVPMAQLTAGEGMARISHLLGGGLQQITGATDPQEAFREQTNRLEHTVAREVAAVRSVQRLGHDDDSRARVESLVEAIRRHGESARSLLEQTLVQSGGRASAAEAAPSGDAARVPDREFFGPLWLTHLLENLPPAQRPWYQGGGPNMLQREAIVNYIDGRRSVGEIHAAVEAELGTTDLAVVERLIEDLETLGLVTWR